MLVRTLDPVQLTQPTWAPPAQGQWAYADYKRLPDDGWRYEVIEGELRMSPAPSTKHQMISLNLAVAMTNFVKAKRLGRVMTAPLDVRLGALADPVQPDILFIRQDRLGMIKEGWIEGAPDLIVEILSPSNWLDDRRTKYRVYAQTGVGEYWIVDPAQRQIEVFILRQGDYALVGRFGVGERASSQVLDGFQVDVDEICPA